MATGPVTSVGPTVRSVFDRIDTDKNAEVSRDEVETMIKDAKVGGGLFGGIVVSMAADKFMEALDTDKNGTIVFDEVKAQLKGLFAQIGTPTGSDPNLPQDPAQIPGKVQEWFNLTDTSKDGALNLDEAQKKITEILNEKKVDMADKVGEVVAKIATYLGDEDKSGKVE